MPYFYDSLILANIFPSCMENNDPSEAEGGVMDHQEELGVPGYGHKWTAPRVGQCRAIARKSQRPQSVGSVRADRVRTRASSAPPAYPRICSPARLAIQRWPQTPGGVPYALNQDRPTQAGVIRGTIGRLCLSPSPTRERPQPGASEEELRPARRPRRKPASQAWLGLRNQSHSQRRLGSDKVETHGV